MQPLKLDYEAPSRPAWIGGLMLLLGAAAASAAAWHHLDLERKAAFEEALFSSLQHKVKVREKRDPEASREEEKMANEVIEDLNRPWSPLFQALESVSNGDVAVLAIEPDAKKGVVRLSGEAKSIESLLAYMANLQGLPMLDHVSLQNHQVQDQDPEKPVRFMILAKWGGLR